MTHLKVITGKTPLVGNELLRFGVSVATFPDNHASNPNTLRTFSPTRESLLTLNDQISNRRTLGVMFIHVNEPLVHFLLGDFPLINAVRAVILEPHIEIIIKGLEFFDVFFSVFDGVHVGLGSDKVNTDVNTRFLEGKHVTHEKLDSLAIRKPPDEIETSSNRNVPAFQEGNHPIRLFEDHVGGDADLQFLAVLRPEFVDSGHHIVVIGEDLIVELVHEQLTPRNLDLDNVLGNLPENFVKEFEIVVERFTRVEIGSDVLDEAERTLEVTLPENRKTNLSVCLTRKGRETMLRHGSSFGEQDVELALRKRRPKSGALLGNLTYDRDYLFVHISTN